MGHKSTLRFSILARALGLLVLSACSKDPSVEATNKKPSLETKKSTEASGQSGRKSNDRVVESGEKNAGVTDDAGVLSPQDPVAINIGEPENTIEFTPVELATTITNKTVKVARVKQPNERFPDGIEFLLCRSNNKTLLESDGNCSKSVVVRDWSPTFDTFDDTTAVVFEETFYKIIGKSKNALLKPSNIESATIGKSVEFSAGGQHACALKTNGKIYCWGSNTFGQLGDGSRTNRILPVQVGMDADWTDVSAALVHTCAIKAPGKLYCWGRNDYSQIGLGPLTPIDNVPNRVGNLENWRSVYSYGLHTCAINNQKKLYCWGFNLDGRAGDGTRVTKAVPTQVGTESDWTEMSFFSHANTSCGKRENNTWYCWGPVYLSEGIEVATTPSALPSNENWSKVFQGSSHFCGINIKKELFCWGRNMDRQTGRDSADAFISNVGKVGTKSDWRHVTPGNNSTCAIDDGGKLYCWGRNDVGQFGNGSAASSSAPLLVQSPGRWMQLHSGYQYVCGLKDDGNVYCSGRNESGQLGVGDEVTRTNFSKVNIDLFQ